MARATKEMGSLAVRNVTVGGPCGMLWLLQHKLNFFCSKQRMCPVCIELHYTLLNHILENKFRRVKCKVSKKEGVMTYFARGLVVCDTA